MKLEVKYLFPTSPHSGANFFNYQLSESLEILAHGVRMQEVPQARTNISGFSRTFIDLSVFKVQPAPLPENFSNYTTLQIVY